MKNLSPVITGIVCTLGLFSFNAFAAEDTKTIASIYENSPKLVGQTIHAQGKVVKVLKGIMKRNFIHIEDGTGTSKDETNDLTVTTKQLANVGDQVDITGVVVLNRDFGRGYLFPLIIEDASIVVKK